MKKISISIDADVHETLTRRAAREGRTKASLIREALDAAVAGWLPVKPKTIGVFASSGDLSERFDAHLAETDFGSDE